MARELSSSDADLSNAESLLVVKPSSLGDIVHTLPAIAAIRNAHPHLVIRWVANREWAPILEGSPAVDHAVLFPRRELRGLGAVFRFLKWSRQLREPKPPDIAIDFQGLIRSAVMARRSRARLVIGFSDAREGAGLLHHRTVDVERARHAVDRYLAVLEPLGVGAPEEPRFALPPGVPIDADLPETFVLLHPFSRGRGKSLTPEQVAVFCRTMAPTPVVIVGKSKQALPSLSESAIDLLNGTSLPQLLGVMQRARFIVSVDSGPMHMAAAVTGELLSIHTWTDPVKVGPFRKEARVWKGGGIQRVGEYRDAPEKSLDDPSVGEIAEWVKLHLRGGDRQNR